MEGDIQDERECARERVVIAGACLLRAGVVYLSIRVCLLVRLCKYRLYFALHRFTSLCYEFNAECKWKRGRQERFLFI